MPGISGSSHKLFSNIFCNWNKAHEEVFPVRNAGILPAGEAPADGSGRPFFCLFFWWKFFFLVKPTFLNPKS